MGPPRGKRDGVIRHLLERENGYWMKKLRYCVNDQPSIQRNWVNLAWTWISGNFWEWFVKKTCVKAGSRALLGRALKLKNTIFIKKIWKRFSNIWFSNADCRISFIDPSHLNIVYLDFGAEHCVFEYWILHVRYSCLYVISASQLLVFYLEFAKMVGRLWWVQYKSVYLHMAILCTTTTPSGLVVGCPSM